MSARLVITNLAIACALLLSGCASLTNSHSQKQPMMNSYIQGDLAGALAEAEKRVKKSAERDLIAWRLEAARLSFATADYDRALDHFRATDDLIASFDERAIISLRDMSAETTVAISNPTAMPYRGLCRDRVALSIYKSLSYLGQGNEEAFRAQLRRLRQDQKDILENYQKFLEADNKQLEEQYKKRQDVGDTVKNLTTADNLATRPENQEFAAGWKTSKVLSPHGYGDFLNPAALFLSALGNIRDENYDNARIDIKSILDARPTHPLFRQYFTTLLKAAGRDIPAEFADAKPFDFPLDRDCVYVLVANGRSAALQQAAIHFPFAFALPYCVTYAPAFTSYVATAGGQAYDAPVISDMDGILGQEFTMRFPQTLRRALTGAMIKDTAFFASLGFLGGRRNHPSRNSHLGEALLRLGIVAAGAAYRHAMNVADTRSWETLPKDYRLTQFPMPKDRKVTISLSGATSSSANLDIPPQAKSAIIFVNAPSAQTIQIQIFPMTTK